jgi:hypothetical protein
MKLPAADTVSDGNLQLEAKQKKTKQNKTKVPFKFKMAIFIHDTNHRNCKMVTYF